VFSHHPSHHQSVLYRLANLEAHVSDIVQAEADLDQVFGDILEEVRSLRSQVANGSSQSAVQEVADSIEAKIAAFRSADAAPADGSTPPVVADPGTDGPTPTDPSVPVVDAGVSPSA
jgi:hypothetical protein